MANEIRNFRAALAQNDRNKSVFTLLVVEIVIFALIASGFLAKTFDSDTVWGMGFVIITALLSVFLIYPLTAFITLVALGIEWASPFIALGIYYHNGWFWFFAACLFLLSIVVNYFGYMYFLDLNTYDD